MVSAILDNLADDVSEKEMTIGCRQSGVPDARET